MGMYKEYVIIPYENGMYKEYVIIPYEKCRMKGSWSMVNVCSSVVIVVVSSWLADIVPSLAKILLFYCWFS
ncbi:hypothetical protein CEXT_637311 [Caerostris extrusa]|uniref:Uncharacterized protein n=1 Tax=Caerostris extrusa TaxID=172846 RepID=A0AAV4QYQ1_CAEEX|nr:hypothetical protein CEXT_637311 [Caerostris extrusa]